MQEIKDVDLIASTTQTIVDEVENYFVPDKYDTSKVIHVDDCILFATLFGKSEVFKDIEFIDMYAADADFYERASKKYNVKKVDSRTYIYYRNIPSSISAELKNKQLINSAH